jgi:hypothetical protein
MNRRVFKKRSGQILYELLFIDAGLILKREWHPNSNFQAQDALGVDYHTFR